MKGPALFHGAVIALFALSLLVAPFAVNQGLLFLIGLAMLQALFALSWNLMFSRAGLGSFGHAMFYGLGAYTTAALIFHGVPVPFFLSILLAVLLGALASFVVGIIVLKRTTGIQFAVLTLALSQLVLLMVSYTNFLGRDDGLSGLARPRIHLIAFSLDLTSPVAYYYFILTVCGLAAGLLLWFVSGPRERRLLAVRIDRERAAFLGVSVLRQQLLAFTLAGAIAALAGALASPWAQIVSTETMSWLTSAQPMLATLLGGAGSFWGPVVGAFSLTAISYFTRTFVGLSEVMVGGVLLVIVMVAPAGIVGFVQSATRRLSKPAPAGSEDVAK